MKKSFLHLSNWYEKHRKEIEDDFVTFLKFQSISTDPSYKQECLNCANWVLKYLQKMGMESELIETPGLPLIFAQNLKAGKNAPTLLIYGHYDVQPVDPLNEWKNPPFQPTVIGKEVYARGAQDNKGQIYYVMVALRSLLSLGKELPINIKVCIEGEEESASIGFSAVLPSIKEKLEAEALLVPDFDIPGINDPAITLGIRGLTTAEITLTGSNIDLHSGQYGGVAYNPNRVLIQMLNQLWDKEGKVQVPHFYDEVLPMDPEEKGEFDFARDLKHFTHDFGIEKFGNEKDYAVMEANWIRPTMEINGLGGGYSGKGFKTVIPAKATAKISCRLVPNQDPEKIFKHLRTFLEARLVKGIKMEIKTHGGGWAVRGSLRSRLAQTAIISYEEVFNKPCGKIMSGGSVPIVGDIVKELGCEVVMMGLGLSTDNIHAPNEHFGLDRLEKGFLVVARIIENYKDQKCA